MAQVRPELATEIESLCNDLDATGARSASQRIRFAAERLDSFNPDAIYHWIDPGRINGELEQVKNKSARFYSGLRNVLALGPLLLTWLALWWASGQYQAQMYAALHPPAGKPQDLVTANMPFLVLWEQGFGNSSAFLTFSHTAFLDVILLAVILALTFLAQRSDAGTLRASQALVDRIDDVVDQMADLAIQGFVPSGTNPEDWARVVQNTVKAVMVEARQVTESAMHVIESIGKDNSDLIRNEMKPLVHTFQQSVASFGTEIAAFQQSASAVSQTATQLGAAAGQVASASTALSNNLAQYQQTATSIAQNIGNLNANQTQFTAQIGAAAQAMDHATKAVQQLTSKLQNELSGPLQDAAQKYQQTENQLSVTTHNLQIASQQLQNASQAFGKVSKGGGYRPGGIIGWLMGAVRP
jgi:methyl-accepting chemotaxis protein